VESLNFQMAAQLDDVPMHVEIAEKRFVQAADSIRRCFRPLRSGRSTSFFDEQFSGVGLSPRPGTPVKDYWRVVPTKNHCCAKPFFENRE